MDFTRSDGMSCGGGRGVVVNGTSRLFVPPPNKLSHSHGLDNGPHSPVNVADGLQKIIEVTAFEQKNETSVLLDYPQNHLHKTSAYNSQRFSALQYFDKLVLRVNERAGVS